MDDPKIQWKFKMFFPGAHLGSWVYITVELSPMSNLADNFGYYIVILTKNTLLIFSFFFHIQEYGIIYILEPQ